MGFSMTDDRFNATQEIRSPWGYADVQTPDYAATSNLDVLNSVTVVNYAQLTGDILVNINSIPQDPVQGNTITLVLTADASPRTVTMGTLILPAGDATVVAAGTTVQITLTYINSSYSITSNIVVA